MKQNKIWFWIFILAAVILVGGFFYFRYFSFIERYIGVNNNTQMNDLPEGVSVVERGGEKRVINDIDGYVLNLGENVGSVKYVAGLLSIQNKVEEDGELGLVSSYDVGLFENSGSLTEEWVRLWIKDQEYSEDYTYKKDIHEGKEFYIIEVPSYGDAEKVLVYQYKNKIVFIDSISENPVDILDNLNLNETEN